MRVLVTGGTGSVGTAVVKRLVQNGWDLHVISAEPKADVPGAEFVSCDITDFRTLREQMRGCEAVVHLAAIPSPRQVPASEMFHINVSGTFNVFEAAAAQGIKKIIQASSINAFGCAWGIQDMQIDYLPIDEAHRRNTTDQYSLSKQLDEDIGEYFWRRDGIASLGYRFPWVTPAGWIERDEVRQHHAAMRAALDELAAQPADQQWARLAEARRYALDFRGRRQMQYGAPDYKQPDDLLLRAYTFDRFNLWSFIDQRDAAQAVEKGLQAAFEGSHALFVNCDYNFLSYDSQTLARLFFPDVTEWKHRLSGTASLLSIEKARQMIGFSPEYLPPSFIGDSK
jgi:nucleoside-diphosphate-sugar epimerase